MGKPSLGDDLETLERNTHLLIEEFEKIMQANISVYKRNVTLIKILHMVLPKEEIEKLIEEHEH